MGKKRKYDYNEPNGDGADAAKAEAGQAMIVNINLDAEADLFARVCDARLDHSIKAQPVGRLFPMI